MGDHPPLQALRNAQLQPCGGGRQSHEAHVYRHEASVRAAVPTGAHRGDDRPHGRRRPNEVVPAKAKPPVRVVLFLLLSYHGTNRFEHVPIPQGRRCVQGGLLREQLQISEGALLSMAGICISGTSRQSPCVFADHRSGVKHDQQLRDWHRKPDRIGVDQRRKNHDQNAADDKSPCHRNNERCLRLHDRLEIIGREDVERQQQEG